MKNVNPNWIIFWIMLFSFLMVWVLVAYFHPLPIDNTPTPAQQAELQCVKNNGIPLHNNSWDDRIMTGCDIYLRKK